MRGPGRGEPLHRLDLAPEVEQVPRRQSARGEVGLDRRREAAGRALRAVDGRDPEIIFFFFLGERMWREKGKKKENRVLIRRKKKKRGGEKMPVADGEGAKKKEKNEARRFAVSFFSLLSFFRSLFFSLSLARLLELFSLLFFDVPKKLAPPLEDGRGLLEVVREAEVARPRVAERAAGWDGGVVVVAVAVAVAAIVPAGGSSSRGIHCLSVPLDSSFFLSLRKKKKDQELESRKGGVKRKKQEERKREVEEGRERERERRNLSPFFCLPLPLFFSSSTTLSERERATRHNERKKKKKKNATSKRERKKKKLVKCNKQKQTFDNAALSVRGHPPRDSQVRLLDISCVAVRKRRSSNDPFGNERRKRKKGWTLF